MKLIPYIVYLFLIALYEVVLREYISVGGVSINLAAFLVLAVAIYKSEIISLWFGFVAGVVLAVDVAGMTGWYGLVTAALGLAAYQTWGRLNLEALHSRLLVVFVGTYLHSSLLVVLGGAGDFFYLMGTFVLPGAVYSTLLAYIFFLIAEGRLTYQKIKSLF